MDLNNRKMTNRAPFPDDEGRESWYKYYYYIDKFCHSVYVKKMKYIRSINSPIIIMSVKSSSYEKGASNPRASSFHGSTRTA